MNKQTRSLIAWSLYDFANSSFSTIILTFVYATYFVQRVAANPIEGASLWGLAMGLSGLSVAIGGPFLGTVADRGGGRKKWLALFSALCLLATLLMWFILPQPRYTFAALLLAGIGAAAVEFAFIFYNAMLPELAPPASLGRWSGWGWASGYVGGLLALGLCLLLFIGPSALVSGLDASRAQEVRATFLLTAAWYGLFILPLFIVLPDPKKKNLLKESFVDTFSAIRSHGNIVRFLVARMFFNDALMTLFAFGGVYAAATFNMSEQKILYFGLSLNVTAGIGAACFAWIDDWLGSKWTINFSLVGLILLGTLALLAQSETQFWIAALLLGLFVGPAQASSRSYMARVTPPHLRNQMFGFFALSARVTQFIGPLVLGGLTYWTGSIRLGMAGIIALLLVGFLLMLRVKSNN